MSEESNQNTQTQTGENQSAADSGASFVTPDQLADFGKNLMGDIRKTVAGMLKTQPVNPEPKPRAEAKTRDGDSESAQLRAELEQMKAREMFRDAASDFSFSKEQSEMLRQLASIEKPENLSEWLSEKAKVFGSPKESAPPTQTATMAEKTRSATDTPAPAGHTPSNPGDDVTRWSPEEYQRQFQMNAPVPSNPYDIRNRSYYKEIRKRAEAQMARTSVWIGPNRG